MIVCRLICLVGGCLRLGDDGLEGALGLVLEHRQHEALAIEPAADAILVAAELLAVCLPPGRTRVARDAATALPLPRETPARAVHERWLYLNP
jgi:hypothetical protein